MIDHDIAQYVTVPIDMTFSDFYGTFPRRYDEPPPLDVSRLIWMASHESQKRYELDTLIIGRQ